MYSNGEHVFNSGDWFVSLHTVQMILTGGLSGKGRVTWMKTNKEQKYFQLLKTKGNESSVTTVKDKPEVTTLGNIIGLDV